MDKGGDFVVIFDIRNVKNVIFYVENIQKREESIEI